VISFIGNRPAIQIGRHQVIDYGTTWLEEALRRAAAAADVIDERKIFLTRSGVVEYLESRCPLKLLQLEDLFDRVRRMLTKIGCGRIARELKPLAPPVTFSLVHAAMAAGNGFELAFFEALRGELAHLRTLGVEMVHFTGMRECVMILRGGGKWTRQCQPLHREIEVFLSEWSHAARHAHNPELAGLDKGGV
jgi:hypothetical protein